MKKEKFDYLESKSLDDVLDIFVDTVCHEHYCPTTCYHFDMYPYLFTIDELRCFILSKYEIKE